MVWLQGELQLSKQARAKLHPGPSIQLALNEVEKRMHLYTLTKSYLGCVRIVEIVLDEVKTLTDRYERVKSADDKRSWEKEQVISSGADLATNSRGIMYCTSNLRLTFLE